MVASVLTSPVMEKKRAIELLGGTVSSAAEAIGITTSAVSQWPDELPDRVADRVLAALVRRHMPPELIGESASAPKEEAA